MSAKAPDALGDARNLSLGLSVVAYLLVLPGLLAVVGFDLFMILAVELAIGAESLFHHRQLPDSFHTDRGATVASRAEDERLPAGGVFLLGVTVLSLLCLVALVGYDVLLLV